MRRSRRPRRAGSPAAAPRPGRGRAPGRARPCRSCRRRAAAPCAVPRPRPRAPRARAARPSRGSGRSVASRCRIGLPRSVGWIGRSPVTTTSHARLAAADEQPAVVLGGPGHEILHRLPELDEAVGAGVHRRLRRRPPPVLGRHPGMEPRVAQPPRLERRREPAGRLVEPDGEQARARDRAAARRRPRPPGRAGRAGRRWPRRRRAGRARWPSSS